MNLNKKIIVNEKEYSDFFELLNSFCIKHSKRFIMNDYEQKMFKIETEKIKMEENEKFRHTYIDINSGGYGIEANIVNTKTNKFCILERNNMLRLYILEFSLLYQKEKMYVKELLYFKILVSME